MPELAGKPIHDRHSNSRPDLSAQLPDLHEALIEQRQFRAAQLAELDKTVAAGALAEVTAALREAATAALADIDSALTRMAAGVYGACTECGAPVAVERLEILPAAAYCMSCQQGAETPGIT